MKKRYYFAQYGYMWSATKEQAIAICTDALAGKGWDFSHLRELKRGYSQRQHRCPADPRNPIYALNCTEYDWQWALDRLQEEETPNA